MDPGEITSDGCAVDLYLLLPPHGEPAIVHRALPPGASILELGSGCGRVTHPLLALGHEVVAVDDSAAMLAHVRGARTVRSRIADLDLPTTFDGVLLGSHLINLPVAADRKALLEAARRHLAPGGRLLVEWHPPDWFDSVAAGRPGQLGDVTIRLEDMVRDGDLLHATVVYEAGERSWRQEFTCRRLTEPALEAELEAAGLVFDGWLTGERDWFAARHRSGG